MGFDAGAQYELAAGEIRGYRQDVFDGVAQLGDAVEGSRGQRLNGTALFARQLLQSTHAARSVLHADLFDQVADVSLGGRCGNTKRCRDPSYRRAVTQ